MIGYCHFATGQHKAALEMCRKVAEAKRIDTTTGREVESRNKWQAIYILGQIYHSLGQAADAIREYRRVEDRFPDAKQAIDYFLRKAIELPEVTTVKPGEPAEVELKFRNVAACDVKVYRIDLMKFSLLEAEPGRHHADQPGRHPPATTRRPSSWATARTTATARSKLALPLKDEGAYLVVCRGDDLHASGLVLVTPLAVEVQEDAVSGPGADHGQGRQGRPLRARRAGQGDRQPQRRFRLRRRPTCAACSWPTASTGGSTVIAQAEPSRYAFFRGTDGLGRAGRRPAQRPPPNAPPNQPAAVRRRSRCRRRSGCWKVWSGRIRVSRASRWRI